MKLIGGLVLTALLFALPARADKIDYTLTVVNAPGGIGDFSWTIQTDGFVPLVTGTTCIDYGICGYYNSFVAVSQPSGGGGCQITQVSLDPGLPASTYFSPLCGGLYGAFPGGFAEVEDVVPEPGFLGTRTFETTNPDGSGENVVTITVSDASKTPEPGTLALLGLGISMFIPMKLKRLLEGTAGLTP